MGYFSASLGSRRALSYTSTRWAAEATEPASASADTMPLSTPRAQGSQDKLQGIVQQIEQLTLLETADLVDMLKSRFNIKDMGMPMMAAPMMGGQGAGGAGAAAEEEAPKAEAKTHFTVKLEKFDAKAKAKIIREIKGIVPNMNLVEAKKFVEGAPKVIKEETPKEEAEAMKKKLEDLGATITLE
ncbi:54S ribosomal protein L12, mitochondrial [Dimargaris verticillata]|uniref:54S ribosomal protein L12, mitochondrial n=1 Tax=Dimargaris verticillata TaxID=2761393 RepID=A0A9W8B4W6_9FUNG|nr:54S ribosomal protein L12, mitochondrial [Dimargaris verticillata]